MTILYEDIERVNGEIKRIIIHKNEYATVASRVQAFRKLYPNGRLGVSIKYEEPVKTYDKDGTLIREQRVVLCEASVYDDSGNFLANNYAEEVEGSSQINNGSFIENACTSAVGRALALCGIGSTDDVASAEEVINAQGFETISKEKAQVLRDMIKDKKADEKYICNFHGVKNLEQMTVKQYTDVVKWLDRGKK